MDTAEIARRFADRRPGYTIVSFGEVGLPHYRVRLRAQVLERKAVPPIEEIVMLGAKRGISDREELRELLGLDRPLFEGVLAELVRKQHVVIGLSETRDIDLTEAGKEVLKQAREVNPATMGLEIFFDSLLRAVVPAAAGLIDARKMDSIGLREVPPARPRPPELQDLDPEAIQRIELRHPGLEDPVADLLALKRIDRRTRVFRPAAILVYLAESRKEVQVAFVVDGEISEAHENAFAAARLSTRMGVRPAAMEHPSALFGTVFNREFEGSISNFGEDEEAPRVLLPTYEAPSLLRGLLDRPTKRLLIISPRVTPEVIDSEFLRALRSRLVEGTEVLIGIGPEPGNPKAAELEGGAFRPLDALFQGFRNLRLKRFARLGPALLARDDDLAVLSRYSWLGSEGDLDRHYVDERGLLLRDPALVEELFDKQEARFQ
jgi:hypothetical protein